MIESSLKASIANKEQLGVTTRLIPECLNDSNMSIDRRKNRFESFEMLTDPALARAPPHSHRLRPSALFLPSLQQYSDPNHLFLSYLSHTSPPQGPSSDVSRTFALLWV